MSFARGEDVNVSVRRDGLPELSILSIRDATWSTGLAEEIDNFLGRRDPFVDGIKNETSLEFTTPPDRSDYFELLDYQRRKNEGDADLVGTQIDVSFSTDFGPDGGSVRVLLADVTLVGGDISAGSRTDKVTTNPRFVGGTWRLL